MKSLSLTDQKLYQRLKLTTDKRTGKKEKNKEYNFSYKTHYFVHHRERLTPDFRNWLFPSLRFSCWGAESTSSVYLSTRPGEAFPLLGYSDHSLLQTERLNPETCTLVTYESHLFLVYTWQAKDYKIDLLSTHEQNDLLVVNCLTSTSAIFHLHNDGTVQFPALLKLFSGRCK